MPPYGCRRLRPVYAAPALPGINICDYQPFSGFKRHHTGDDREPGNTNNRFENITDDEDEDGEQHYVHR